MCVSLCGWRVLFTPPASNVPCVCFVSFVEMCVCAFPSSFLSREISARTSTHERKYLASSLPRTLPPFFLSLTAHSCQSQVTGTSEEATAHQAMGLCLHQHSCGCIFLRRAPVAKDASVSSSSSFHSPWTATLQLRGLFSLPLFALFSLHSSFLFLRS